jgi:hypothetical protein
MSLECFVCRCVGVYVVEGGVCFCRACMSISSLLSNGMSCVKLSGQEECCLGCSRCAKHSHAWECVVSSTLRSQVALVDRATLRHLLAGSAGRGSGIRCTHCGHQLSRTHLQDCGDLVSIVHGFKTRWPLEPSATICHTA